MSAESTNASSIKLAKSKKEKEKKEKREKRKIDETVGESSNSVAVEAESKEERRARKKAKKLAKEAESESKAVTIVKDDESKEERKARRRAEKLAKELAEDDAAGPAEKEEKKVKKSKKDQDSIPAPAEGDVALPTDVPDDEVALKKKSKKDKKRSSDVKASSPEGEQQGVFADSTLTDQAKKAIHYVQLHAATHSKKDLPEDGQRWKFNKAKQGWLMRNVWNDTEVPEAYFDQVVYYLKTLPGLARKGMIETAKKHAKAPNAGEKVEAETVPVDDGAAPKAEAADAENQTKAAEEEKADDEGEESDDPVIVEMRRERAQRILKALGAR